MADALPIVKRRSNFTPSENNVLQASVQKNAAALFGPGDNDIKTRVWMKILDQVNKASSSGRSLAEIKARWKKIRYREKSKT